MITLREIVAWFLAFFLGISWYYERKFSRWAVKFWKDAWLKELARSLFKPRD